MRTSQAMTAPHYGSIGNVLVPLYGLTSPYQGSIKHIAYSVLRTPYKKYTKGGAHSAGEH